MAKLKGRAKPNGDMDIHVWLPGPVWKKLTKLAQDEDRSLTGQVRQLIREALEAREAA